ncbi:MAG: PAS domain S-box protein, partial [Pseudanabaena sp.]
LTAWKTKILDVVGENGQVIVEVIPELAGIIGNQPSVIELTGNASQNRFNLLLQKFIQVFATPEHPLVMFFDDLQWADLSSLKLMQLLTQDTRYLLMLGAYRDNEVSPVHPLMMTISEMLKTGITVNTITLQTLRQADIHQWIADTLICDLPNAKPLAELVYQKTQGNPFFAVQLLKALYEEKIITFNWDLRNWPCDIAQARLLHADDVVEFMASQLQKLPLETQDVLKVAACIGAQFDLQTLAIASQQSLESTAMALWQALQAGFIIPTTEAYKLFMRIDANADMNAVLQTKANVTYKFLHDRVQQAAYSLIPEEQQQSAHLAIARSLRQNTPDAELEANIFGIVNHWNRAIAILIDPLEKTELAQFNLIAGSKAKASNAYEAALKYFTAGLTLMDELGWQSQPSLILTLHEGAAAAAYLCGDFAQMEHWVSAILAQGLEPLKLVKIFEIQIQAYITQGKFSEAIAIAENALEHFNIYLPKQPASTDIVPAMQDVATLLNGRSIGDLLDLPVMTDSASLASMQLLSSINSATYISTPLLFPFVVLAQVKLSIQAGNMALSSLSYCCHAILLSSVLEDLDGAYEFGQLGLQLAEKFKVQDVQAKVIFFIGCFILHCKSHCRSSLSLLKESFKMSLELGDFEYVGHNANIIWEYAYAVGQELATLQEEIEFYIATLLKLNVVTNVNSGLSFLRTIQRLQTTQNQDWLIAQMEQLHHTLTVSNNLGALHTYWVYRLTTSYLLNKMGEAKQDAVEASQTLDAGASLISIPIFYFYDSLAALVDFTEEADKTTVLDRISENQTKLLHRAYYAPMNFQHKYDLVEAERHRVLGNKLEAIEYYDHAIAGAKENNYIQEEALANELAAKFYLGWGREKIAQVYMTEAYYGYVRWGASAKVTDLENRYPQLLAPILRDSSGSFKKKTTHSSSSTSEAIDLETLLKASQAISEEIELSKLLEALLNIANTNSGADKCVLLLQSEQELQIVALVESEQPAQILPSPISLEHSEDMAIGIVNQVKRSLEPIVLSDARQDAQFASDRYILKYRPKSILCMPVLKQGKLIGVLYLENSLTIGAFTSDRLEILNLICSQAAISLENAQLYQTLYESENKFRRLVEGANDMIWATKADSTLTYLSPQFHTMFGLSPSKWVGQSFTKLIHPDDLEKTFAFAKFSLERLENLANIEFRHLCQDGSYLWVMVNITPIIDKEGKAIGLQGILRDISEQKRTEAALQASELELRSLFMGMDDVVFVIDRDGTYLKIAPTNANRLYLPADILIGKSLQEIFPPKQSEEFLSIIRKTIDAQQTQEYEYSLLIQDKEFWFSARCSPLTEESVVWVARDISDRKATELERDQLLQELYQLNKSLELRVEERTTALVKAQERIIAQEKLASLGTLTAGIAHELRNPLNFVTNFALGSIELSQELLEAIEPLRPSLDFDTSDLIATLIADLQENSTTIRVHSQRAENIIFNMMQHTRNDDTKAILQPTQINDLLDQSLKLAYHSKKMLDTNFNIKILTDYAANLDLVALVAGSMSRAFINLIENACDAMLYQKNLLDISKDAENYHPTLRLSTRSLGDRIEIRILDNGCGIDLDIQSKVLDPFFTTKPPGEGTGLGLSLTHDIIVKQHNGTLTINSNPSQFTEIIVTIPKRYS